jgi:hypothetical protein
MRVVARGRVPYATTLGAHATVGYRDRSATATWRPLGRRLSACRSAVAEGAGPAVPGEGGERAEQRLGEQDRTGAATGVSRRSATR